MAEMLSDFGHIIGLNGSTQVAVMPTYSTVATGTIVQYVGSTDANYTNGYFYKATASGWEVVDVQGEDTDKADKVDSATAGNLAGLNASGNLTDAGWSSDKTTSNVTGNPISISGLKSNQLAKDPVITFEPIQAGSGDPSPSNVRAISGYDKIEVLSAGQNLFDKTATRDETNATASINGDIITVTGRFSCNFDLSLPAGIYTCLCSDILETSGSDPTPRVSFGYTDGTFSDSFMYGTINTNGKTVKCLAIYATSSPNNTATVVYKNIAIIAGSNYNNVKLTLGQTIYGGTLDVEKGILTVTRKYLDCKSLEFTTGASTGGLNWSEVSDCKGPYGNDTISNKLIAKSSIDGWNSTTPCYSVASGGILRIYGSQALFTTGDYADSVVIGTLITPYTIQLTPHEISLLKDYAYVSTNGTNMSFSYHNGEMASLGDVENLGKTMNLLGDYVNSIEDITSKISFNSSYTDEQNRTKAIKFGNLIVIQLQVRGDVSTKMDQPFFTVDSSIKPRTIVASSVTIHNVSNGKVHGFGNVWYGPFSANNTFTISIKNIDNDGNGIIGTIVYFI